jgi:OOP family OmpA-OmpF porin
MKMLSRAMLAASLAVASASAFAADGGNYFVNLGVGQSKYHVDQSDDVNFKTDKHDTAVAARFGYQWHGAMNFGVETGYVDLGKLVGKYDEDAASSRAEVHARGLLLGGNLTYRFATPFYVQVRGGWLNSYVEAKYRYSSPTYNESDSFHGTGNGWYAGIGGGYDFSRNFGIGVHYDNYHVVVGQDDYFDSGYVNVSAVTVQLEYRF